jgi:hypothetical protein
VIDENEEDSEKQSSLGNVTDSCIMIDENEEHSDKQ